MIWFFLTSGLFLGWSLGANDSANIIGTAVSTRMLKFKVAASICGFFIIAGAIIDGGGATHTLGSLGDVNAIAGSFTVAFAAATAVFLLIRRGLPVSVSQAIVGAIIGWNIFTASPTDIKSLTDIIFTWIFNPFLACAFTYIIYKSLKKLITKLKLHMLELDIYNRIGLIIAAAFGSYSLGANNISKVVGVFMTSSPFQDITFYSGFTFSAVHQLFLIGALSMVVGVFTYSQKTISTIGHQISKLNPVSAFSSIFASSIVLFLFSSQSLAKLMISYGLPSFPLVPISISQTMVGAVAGIGLVNGVGSVNYRQIGKIAIGWVITPVLASLFCLIALFIVQNVFQQKVVNPLMYQVNISVLTEMQKHNLPARVINKLEGNTYETQAEFRKSLNDIGITSEGELFKIFDIARVEKFVIDSNFAKQKLNPAYFTPAQIEAVVKLHNIHFEHRWQIEDRLKLITDEWRKKEESRNNEVYNSELKNKYQFLFENFKIRETK